MEQVIIPKTSAVLRILLRADLTTQWRNRRGLILTLIVPIIILWSWKGFIAQVGSGFVLGNCITVGLMAIGLMGYTNSIARDREKGIFQRLRVAPLANWNIMASRLCVQLLMITIMTVATFIAGINLDGINDITIIGYLLGLCIAFIGGAVYLSLGQVIAGLIKNPETVNSTTRLVYFVFIMVGMISELNPSINQALRDIEHWSPYGTVKTIVMSSLHTASWNTEATISLLVSLGYILVFATIGIKKFKWR